MTAAGAADAEPVPPPLLELIQNLAASHREHEKFYSQSPLADARRIQAASRALKALAERWGEAAPRDHPAASPLAGAVDLNDPAVVAERGILFLEDEQEPVELARLKRDLRTTADDAIETGGWMVEAMARSWAIVGGLVQYPELADVLGERHRIVANDIQAAQLTALAGRLIHRALELLERVELSTSALREDLAGQRIVPRYLFSSSELLDRAADLAAESAILVHDNERRWRVFAGRVDALLDAR